MNSVDYPGMPRTNELIEGPVLFRMSLVDVDSEEDGDDQAVEALCHFLGKYVGNMYGFCAINK